MTRDMIFAMAPATNLCNNNMHSPKLTDRSEANSIQKANEERLSDIKVVSVQRKSTWVSKCETKTKERQYRRFAWEVSEGSSSL